MTDRIRHITVTLDRDYRDDDAEPILSALRQIRGVAEVNPMIVTGADVLARMTARVELQGRVWDAIAKVFREDVPK